MLRNAIAQHAVAILQELKLLRIQQVVGLSEHKLQHEVVGIVVEATVVENHIPMNGVVSYTQGGVSKLRIHVFARGASQ